MQTAAVARRVAAAWAASAFHSSAAALSKSTPRIRFAVREKRRDAKSALKNILLNGSPYQESNNKQTRKQKGSGRTKIQHPCPGKNPYGKNKRGQNWKSFDDDECTDTPYGSFGGKRSFTWYWPGEDDELGSSPSGFQWRDESQSAKSRKKFLNESDVDEEEESGHDDLRSYRISLGLPILGPLKLEHIKAAFAHLLSSGTQTSIKDLHRLKQRKNSDAVWKHTTHWLVPLSQVANYFGRIQGQGNFF